MLSEMSAMRLSGRLRDVPTEHVFVSRMSSLWEHVDRIITMLNPSQGLVVAASPSPVTSPDQRSLSGQPALSAQAKESQSRTQDPLGALRCTFADAGIKCSALVASSAVLEVDVKLSCQNLSTAAPYVGSLGTRNPWRLQRALDSANYLIDALEAAKFLLERAQLLAANPSNTGT